MLFIVLLLQLGMFGAFIWFIAHWLEQAKPREVVQKARHDRGLILDSCALIDGRVTEIVKTGFISKQLIVPQFIISELQTLADGKDSHKRERARFGLDVVKQLQGTPECNVLLDPSGSREIGTTDEKLVALALKKQADLFTTDYNLNKVAEIRGVHVLNIHELAQHVRPVVLPGEQREVKVLQKGSSAGQGVGYMDDGTMIVVDQGAKYIGRKINVQVTRNHQTIAGKMLFGVPVVKVAKETTSLTYRIKKKKQLV